MDWTVVKDTFEWVCAGVDPTIEGNGGTDCLNFLSPWQRIVETLLMSCIAIFEVIVSWKHLDIPSTYIVHESDYRNRTTKQVLLVILCVTLGIEIGLKFATRTVVYLLNPCHVITIIQIYLLSAPPSKTVLVVFRMHMATLAGPFLALVLPVLNTRLLPCETGIYWFQHILIYFIIPPYLIKLGGPYATESCGKLWWCIFCNGFQWLYHLILLQGLGMLLEVNLNNMLCPAPSDPFYGKSYRLWALLHQHALVPVHYLIYTSMVRFLLPPSREACNGAVVGKSE